MDTPMDIARDEWWQAHLDSCETCAFVKRDKKGRYYCDNPDNDNQGLFSDEIYECEDWSERR